MTQISTEEMEQTARSLEQLRGAFTDREYRDKLTMGSTILQRAALACKMLEEEEEQLFSKTQLDSEQLKRLNKIRKLLAVIKEGRLSQ